MHVKIHEYPLVLCCARHTIIGIEEKNIYIHFWYAWMAARICAVLRRQCSLLLLQCMCGMACDCHVFSSSIFLASLEKDMHRKNYVQHKKFRTKRNRSAHWHAWTRTHAAVGISRLPLLRSILISTCVFPSEVLQIPIRFSHQLTASHFNCETPTHKKNNILFTWTK